jgi:hypothetical protein
MTEKRNWWSELSNWEERFEKRWIRRIELVAGITAATVLTLGVLWGGKPHSER